VSTSTMPSAVTAAHTTSRCAVSCDQTKALPYFVP
jgi:hypothetical protein